MKDEDPEMYLLKVILVKMQNNKDAKVVEEAKLQLKKFKSQGEPFNTMNMM